MFKKFFTYKGRIGRRTYVISLSLVLCAVFSLALILFWIMYTSGIVTLDDYKSAIPHKISSRIIFSLLFATIISFPIVKRLHDIEASGYFFLFYPGPHLLILACIDLNGQFRFELLEEITWLAKGISVVMVFLWILSIFALLVACTLLVFMKGTKGLNNYGPDPLQTGNH